MKNISIAFVVFLISQMFAVADGLQHVPDLSKAFPTEKLIGKALINNIEYFNYNTDLEYEQLKSKLITFLGNEWSESQPNEPKTELEKKLRTMYEGSATFSNAHLKGTKIEFSVKKTRASSGKKFIASLHVETEVKQ